MRWLCDFFICLTEVGLFPLSWGLSHLKQKNNNVFVCVCAKAMLEITCAFLNMIFQGQSGWDERVSPLNTTGRSCRRN